MMKKIKNMKKNTVVSIAIVLVFAILLTSGAAVFNWSGAATQKKTTTTKVKKPGQVKGLKKVKVGKNSIKISFKKVKGADGYQILIYQRKKYAPDALHGTPILYAKTTKKTSYTLKGLMPGTKYTIKVKAYKKDKKEKAVYSKVKSINVNTTGKINETYIVCNTCRVTFPNYNVGGEHFKAALKIHNEIHAGETIVWK